MIVKVRRALISVVALAVAIIAQLVIVNRASLPGGDEPDLVLLTVTALAVANGPMTGMLAGFCGGLALDIAPPGGHLAGEYALVFCLVGYLCGRLRETIDTTGDHAAVTALIVMAAGVAGGEAGKVAIGLMLSDPQVTGPVVKRVLPGAVLYDLLLCPFALWLILVVSPRREPVRGMAVQPRPRPRLLTAGEAAGVFRLASVGAAPRLRFADGRAYAPAPVRKEARLRFGDGRAPAPAPARKEARLRFGDGRAPAPAPARKEPRLRFGDGRAYAPAPVRKEARLRFGDSRAHAPAPVRKEARLRFGDSRAHAPAPVRKEPKLRLGSGRSSGASRTAAAASLTPSVSAGGRPARVNFSAHGGSALSAHRTRGRQGKSPSKGWLRPARTGGTAPQRKSPGKGWLRPAKPVKENWYTKSPSTGWLKRSRRRRRRGSRR
jgi:rod shape-determining protein MreD